MFRIGAVSMKQEQWSKQKEYEQGDRRAAKWIFIIFLGIVLVCTLTIAWFMYFYAYP